jgi:carbonic anhydrase/acetyltransferase-like protein (isoleucine patch superfamily)
MNIIKGLSARAAMRVAWLKRAPDQARGAVWAARNGIKCAGAPTIYRRQVFPRVDNQGGRIEFGRGVWFRGFQFPSSIGVGPQGVLRVGDYAGINQGANIFAADSIAIGKWTMLSDLVAIFDTNFHEIEPNAGVVSAPVVIGDNVWIGAHAIVLPGVTIGRDTVVGAGSVVVSSLPAGVLATGNPATVKRPLRHKDDWIRILARSPSTNGAADHHRGSVTGPRDEIPPASMTG